MERSLLPLGEEGQSTRPEQVNFPRILGKTFLAVSAVLTLANLRIEGTSVAGEETWFRVSPPGLAFDVGRGAPQLVGARDVFLSHGHLDHALGLPFVLSQRRMQHLSDRPHGASHIFCPRELAPALANLIAAAEAMEAVSFDHELHGLEPGARVELGKGFAVEAFRTDHVVPSLGFHLLAARKRLARHLAGLDSMEIVRRRQAGEAVEETVEEIALTYCGDTGPGVFESEPRLFTARVLMIECTFLGEDQRAKGSAYGHLHADDLAQVAGRFANQAIVLHHLSRRHRRGELLAYLARELPELAPRVHVWGEGA